MTASDIGYADGWLYNPFDSEVYPRTITPLASIDVSNCIWDSLNETSSSSRAFFDDGVWPSIYLKADIKIISGTEEEPYILLM